MTLSSLASYICTKLSDTDTDSVTVCKSFINRRYEMIWNSALWAETMGIVSKAVNISDTVVTLSGTPDITFFQSVTPPSTSIDFPVAMRFTVTGLVDGLNVDGSDWMTFFRLDPNIWNDIDGRRATPVNFVNLPKDGNGACRIKPVPTPDAAGTMFVLGKLKYVDLGDSDSPSLRGSVNALLAFAEGDMLERARQYGKAQTKFTEAGACIEIMKDMEKGQQQSVSTIVPDAESTGDPCGGPI